VGAPSLYLSYSRYETEFAIRLATDLKNASINIWCDRLRLTASDDLRLGLKQALLEAQVIVCVVSPTYLTAKYTRHEWTFARKNHKILLPLLTAHVDHASAPMELELRRALDFKGWRDAATYKAAFARLRGMFGELSETLQPGPLDRYLNDVIGWGETQLAGAEILDLPDQDSSPSARVALRPLSPLESVWGRVGQVSFAAENGANEPHSLTSTLRDEPRLILTGKPGAGKSTALSRLALDQAYAYRAQPDTQPLPLLISLTKWQDDQSFERFLASMWAVFGIEDIDVLPALSEGKVLLLLDDLNELSSAALSQKLSSLKAYLTGDTAPKKVIIAARSNSEMAVIDLGLPVYEVLPLSDEAIEAVVRAQLGDEAGLLTEKLFAAPAFPYHDNPAHLLARSLGELAGLTFLHRIYPSHELPRNSGALYKRLVPLIWVWRRVAQTPFGVPHKELTAAISDLALFMLDHDQTSLTVSAAEDVVGLLKTTSLKAATEMRVLNIEQGRVRFVNLPMRDYFAGLSLSRLELVVRMTAPRFDVHGDRISGKWDEVARLMCGAVPKADALLRDIAEVDPHFAAQVMKELFMPIPTHLLKVLRHWDWQPDEVLASELRDPSLRLEAQTVLLPYLEDADPIKREGAAWALRVIGDSLVNTVLPLDNAEPTAEVTLKKPWSKSAQPQRVASPAPPSPPTRVGELLKQLFSPDWKTRQGAVVALGESGDDSIVVPLIETLSDSDEHVRFAAVRALERYQGTVAVDGLLKALRDNNFLVKDAAGEGLAKLGSASLPGLLAVLDDKALDVDTKGVVIETLGVIASPLAIPSLTSCLQDDSVPHHEGTRISELAAAALERIGTPESIELAAEWRKEQQPTEEISAVVDLNYSDAPVDISLLQDTPRLITPTEHPEVTVKKLLAALIESDVRKQHAAAKALGEYTRQLRGTDAPQVLRLLEQAVGAKDDFVVRWAAVEALGWLGDDEALPTLQEALHDQHFTVKLAAIRALQEIGAATAMWSLMGCLKDNNPLVREKAAEALGRIGDDEAAPQLTEILQDDEPFVRRAAAESLGMIGNHKSAPALIELLDDPELLVRWKAAEALGKLAEPAAVKPLTAWLNDEGQPSWSERRVCDLAADTLEKIPTPEAVAALEMWRSKLSKN
jgi:HEAT repeat protein